MRSKEQEIEIAEAWAGQVTDVWHAAGEPDSLAISDGLLFKMPPTGLSSLSLRGLRLSNDAREVDGVEMRAIFIERKAPDSNSQGKEQSEQKSHFLPSTV